MQEIAERKCGRRPLADRFGPSLALTLTLALTLVVLAGCATTPKSTTETANIGVVDGFIAAWADPKQAVAFLADDASVRMIEDQPPVVGREAVLAAFESFMTPGVSLEVETLETTAHGPVVLNRRIDTMKTAGQPDQVFPVAGVFVVKDGKIVEWTDYLIR